MIILQLRGVTGLTGRFHTDYEMVDSVGLQPGEGCQKCEYSELTHSLSVSGEGKSIGRRSLLYIFLCIITYGIDLLQ